MPHHYLTAYTLLALTATTLTSEAANLTTVAVPVGAVIDRCSTPGTIALTFDDGPFMYTNDLLEILGEYGAPCTFFLNGHNLGDIYQYADVVRRIVNEGHQLGSHTFGHRYLTSLDHNAIVAQMTELENAFQEVVGRVPTYTRPPYLAVNSEVLSTMAGLGYHVIGASIDTKDYENDDLGLILNSLEKFKAELNAGGNIVLSHDVHEQTVYTLARTMLEEIQARGLQPVTVGDCLGDPEASWYR